MFLWNKICIVTDKISLFMEKLNKVNMNFEAIRVIKNKNKKCIQISTTLVGNRNWSCSVGHPFFFNFHIIKNNNKLVIKLI